MSNFHLDAPNFGRTTTTTTLLAASNEDTVLTAAQSIEGIVTMSPASTDKKVTTASASAIVTALGDGARAGSTFELTLVNASATKAITFEGGSSVTIGGAAGAVTVASATSATFLGRVTSTSSPAVTYYRKGG